MINVSVFIVVFAKRYTLLDLDIGEKIVLVVGKGRGKKLNMYQILRIYLKALP